MVTPSPVGAQDMPLLHTKLYVPPLRHEQVARPRLVERLDAGLVRKLTLVSAPAGFGKTTLVSEWVGRLRLEAAKNDHTANRVAWLSLDERDGDPTRFLFYLIAAVQTIETTLGRGALNALHASQPQPPSVEVILTMLINEIATFPDGVVLVLDDYHLIQSQPIHDALTFLLEHLPPGQSHLVIVTRDDPLLPLARLRARGELTELRATDLRFSFSEAAEFLNHVMGLNLSIKDIAALERRTEGWIAGLQLAAVSMQGRKDVTGFVQSFTGSHHFVLDYLVEEVVDQQSESIQDFLLHTSILDQLTGPLCDALTGRSSGQRTLEMLERANLFIIPLDDERRWYRYHHLFAELLRQRLDIAHSNSIHDLHSKAAVWYEAHGDPAKAIHHALVVNDIKTATRLMEKGALEALERGELGLILNWVDRLSATELKKHPWLFIYHSWALLMSGQAEAVGPRLENTEWLLNAISEDDETKKQEMLGLVAGLKAILAYWQRDISRGLDFANQALAGLPEHGWIRGCCAIVVGSSYMGNGHLDAARDAYAEAYSIGKASGIRLLTVDTACNLGHALELEGHLQQAVELLRESFQLAKQDGQELPLSGFIHLQLGTVLYELNDLDAASQHLEEAIKLCRHLADRLAQKIAYCFLARVQLALGKNDSVLDSIQKAQDADPSPGTPFDLRGGEYPQIRLWLKEKKFQDLQAWIEDSAANIDDISLFKAKLTCTMRARALIAVGREHSNGTYLNDAQNLLQELLEMADRCGWGSKVIEILALQALALQGKGDMDQAMAALERALVLAEPEGFVRTFVDEGPLMARLLYEAAVRGIAPDYARRLLSVFPAAELEQPDLSEAQVPSSGWVEPLSGRELQVLELIAKGLTNPEIASRLFLSLNTVKAHTRNIYGKLGVHSRTQAVARSGALGILAST
jgi:ATP/maltotriose-dependent transcriptional regulator MalT